MGFVIVIVAGMIFGVGAIAVITEHLQKIAKIKADAQKKGSREVLDAIEAIRNEVTALRDTTTQYDMSFDTALHRLESRMEHLEQRVSRVEQGSETVNNIRG